MPASGGELRDSKHNLSVSGPGSVTAETESRLCVFCHAPHNASPAVPLWNHTLSVDAYSPYASSTLTVSTPPDQPSGSSKLCLACHDGTLALGQTVNDGLLSLLGAGPGGRMPAGASNLGTDLTDDHPVSFVPNYANSEIVAPPPGDAVQYDATGELQCVSCHDPHSEDRDPVSLRFLVKDNRESRLCTTCHEIQSWTANPSSHQSSNAPYAASDGAHTGYTTVRDNGCESCHRPHTASAPERNLKAVEEFTCDACHDGTVATSNIAAEFNKPYAHPTYDVTPSAHDPVESPTNPAYALPEISPGAERHAECQDCHDPHASFAMTASAPLASGALAGAWGIDSAGSRIEPALYEYQVCYKCHADSANKPQVTGLPDPPYTNRQLLQFNVRKEFDPLNPSHHAVEAPGRNPDVPSLLSPYDVNSVIYCGDCHASDSGPGAGGAGPAGPHGSIYPHLLERNLETGANNGGQNFGQMYALCFKCHSQNSILGDQTFDEHKKHIDDENSSCTVCHDPHGISSEQGNDIENSHLINFDLDVVFPSSSGQLRFEDRGSRRGACYLSCHGKDHDPLSY
jgi:predicted CXXCH cytochrome family protein